MAFGTRMFRAMIGKAGGSDGVDDTYAHRSMDGFGAFILGRNMFGPIRGPWPDETWKGWWGDIPLSRAHLHPDPPSARSDRDGRRDHLFFVTRGIEAALDQAKLAANGRDVKIGGGVQTVRRYLRAGLIDELHFACHPSCSGKAKRCSPE